MLLQNGTVQGIRSILCHNSDCSTLKLNQNIEIEDWHLVGSLRMDTKALFWAQITSEGRREFSGWEWEEVGNKESSGVNKCGGNCLVTFTQNSSFHLSISPPNNTVYTVRVLFAAWRAPGLAGWWAPHGYFLALRRTGMLCGVGCRD